jgi:bromodomain-containing protein 7/9
VPKEAHAVDFGAYATLPGEMGMWGLGTEEAFVDAIRDDIDDMMDIEELGQDGYWTSKTAADAQSYIQDVVYGGVDGLAYVRSLAEFVSPPLISVGVVCSLMPVLSNHFNSRLRKRSHWSHPAQASACLWPNTLRITSLIQ